MDFNVPKILSCDLIIQEISQVSDLYYIINITDYTHLKVNDFRKSPVNAATNSHFFKKRKKRMWTNIHKAKICLSLQQK